MWVMLWKLTLSILCFSFRLLPLLFSVLCLCAQAFLLIYFVFFYFFLFFSPFRCWFHSIPHMNVYCCYFKYFFSSFLHFCLWCRVCLNGIYNSQSVYTNCIRCWSYRLHMPIVVISPCECASDPSCEHVNMCLRQRRHRRQRPTKENRQCIGMSAHITWATWMPFVWNKNWMRETHWRRRKSKYTLRCERRCHAHRQSHTHTHPFEPIHTTAIMRFNVYRDAVRSLVLYILLFRLAFFP